MSEQAAFELVSSELAAFEPTGFGVGGVGGPRGIVANVLMQEFSAALVESVKRALGVWRRGRTKF